VSVICLAEPSFFFFWNLAFWPSGYLTRRAMGIYGSLIWWYLSGLVCSSMASFCASSWVSLFIWTFTGWLLSLSRSVFSLLLPAFSSTIRLSWSIFGLDFTHLPVLLCEFYLLWLRRCSVVIRAASAVGTFVLTFQNFYGCTSCTFSFQTSTSVAVLLFSFVKTPLFFHLSSAFSFSKASISDLRFITLSFDADASPQGCCRVSRSRACQFGYARFHRERRRQPAVVFQSGRSISEPVDSAGGQIRGFSAERSVSFMFDRFRLFLAFNRKAGAGSFLWLHRFNRMRCLPAWLRCSDIPGTGVNGHSLKELDWKRGRSLPARQIPDRRMDKPFLYLLKYTFMVLMLKEWMWVLIPGFRQLLKIRYSRKIERFQELLAEHLICLGRFADNSRDWPTDNKRSKILLRLLPVVKRGINLFIC